MIKLGQVNTGSPIARVSLVVLELWKNYPILVPAATTHSLPLFRMSITY